MTTYSPLPASAPAPFDLDAVWRQIMVVPSPGVERLPAPHRLAPASQPAVAAGQARPCASSASSTCARPRTPGLILAASWDAEASLVPFDSRLRVVQKLKLQYADLTKAYAEAQAKAAESHRAAQHAMYLRSHTIEAAHRPGVGPAWVTSLREAGITTAADVTERGAGTRDGFGPKLTTDLLAWRQVVEAGFAFDAQAALTAYDRERLARTYDRQFQDLQDRLLAVPAELEAIRVQPWSAANNCAPGV